MDVVIPSLTAPAEFDERFSDQICAVSTNEFAVLLLTVCFDHSELKR